MSVRFPQGTVFDGYLGLSGTNNGATPSQVPPDMAYRATNLSFRFGRPKTRPPFRYRPLTFVDDPLGATRNLFERGKFQGSYRYRTASGSYLVAAIHGRIFMIDTLSWTVTDLSDQVGLNDWQVDRMYFCQVEKYLVIQDGSNVPIILDGFSARRAVYNQDLDDGTSYTGGLVDEVPVGTVMAYGQGRLFVAQKGQNKFVAGDITDPDNPITALRFYETQFLTGGGSLAIPREFGDIQAMAFLPVLNSVIGQGPLIVFGERGVHGFNVARPRDEWQTAQLGTALLYDAGSLAHRVETVNSDMFYFAVDGLRSIRQTADDLDTPDMTPISREATAYFRRNTDWLMHAASLTLFRNRLFCTVAPERRLYVDTDTGLEYHDTRFRGLVVLDSYNVASLGDKQMPHYDGVWTGPYFLDVISGQFGGSDRCFAWSKDFDAYPEPHPVNRIYELMVDEAGPDDGPSGPRDIEWMLETRSFGFQNVNGAPGGTYFNAKTLQGVDVYLTEMEGPVEISAYYSPDLEPLFWPFENQPATVHAKVLQCPEEHEETCGDLQTPLAQVRPRVSLGVPSRSVACRADKTTLASTGYEFRLLLQGSGVCAVDKLRVRAFETHAEPLNLPCHSSDAAVLLSGCQVDSYAYRIIPEIDREHLPNKIP